MFLLIIKDHKNKTVSTTALKTTAEAINFKTPDGLKAGIYSYRIMREKTVFLEGSIFLGEKDRKIL